ncbi:MAG: hypothetical protein HKL80_10655, partial [Acidimicrobiales bacterium]|nr:hypothetical protein [Acidimicrobiales bacterium]
MSSREENETQSSDFPAPKLQGTYQVSIKGGWIGLFSGDDTRKAINRALMDLERQNVRVLSAVPDQWSYWKRLWNAIIGVLTLGFLVRKPSVILI